MIYNNEARLGVNAVGKIFNKEFQWVFRDQPINDFGIDALVEVTKLNLYLKTISPTGKLIGVQVKSGMSYFKEFVNDYFVFYGQKKHLDYWLNYSISVIVVLYDKNTDSAYWQMVNLSTVILTDKSFKLFIPIKNRLNADSREALTSIGFFRDSYHYKLSQLLSTADEISLLLKDQLFLYIEIDDIPNTDSYHIMLAISDVDTENYYEVLYNYDDQNISEYYLRLPQNISLTRAINDTIPWANLWLDEFAVTDELLTDRIADEMSGYDLEDNAANICAQGRDCSLFELACYYSGSYWLKLSLKPNELTDAFLRINTFLNKELLIQTRIFI
jgi:hypothetical protein